MLNILLKISFFLLISMAAYMLRIIITFICKLQVGDFGLSRGDRRHFNALILPHRIIMFLGDVVRS